MKNQIQAFVLCLCIIASSTALDAQVPGILTYQGRVSAGGVGFTGEGQFKFALVTPPNPIAISLWSNDQSSVGGSEPVAHVLVPVAQGAFTVPLGDPFLGNMVEIPASVFGNPDVRLRIWFNDGVNGWAQLTPDPRITTAGYAFRAAGTSDGSITSSMLAPNAVTTDKIAPNSVTPDKIPLQSISGLQIAQNSLSSEDIADTLRLRDLDIESAGGLDRIELLEENNSGVIRMNHGSIGRFMTAFGTPAGGFLQLFDQLGGELTGQITVELGSSEFGGYARVLQNNTATGVQLNGQNGSLPGGTVLIYRETGLSVSLHGQNSAGGGEISVRNPSGLETVEIVGAENNNPAGQIRIRRQNGTDGLILDGQLGAGGGQISVLNTLGDETVEILGAESANNLGGQVTVKRINGQAGVVMDGQLGDGGGELAVFNAVGQSTILLQGTEGSNAGDGAGQILVRQGDGQTGVLVDGQAGTLGGQITVNNVAGSVRVNVVGQMESGGGYIGVRDSNGTVTAMISGAEVNGDGAEIALAKGNGTKTVFLDAELGGGGGSLRLAKSDGSIPIKLDASAAGGGRVTTQVLEITGGSDLSEQFHVRSDGISVEPGMVVCIDLHHPGDLIPSAKSYDRTVAGVISGAGGVQSGLRMGQVGTLAHGGHSVALTGRVYCRVVAGPDGIQPGDLLTTSDVPGHAMKAADATRAQGAVLGKAMTPLRTGRGLVLVLVTLQ